MLREEIPVTASSIYLTPCEFCTAYVHWDIADTHLLQARLKGGKTLVLRVFDVTDIDPSQQMPHSVQQFSCIKSDCQQYVIMPEAGDYIAEIGYDTPTGEWLLLARSAPVFVPGSAQPLQCHYSYN